MLIEHRMFFSVYDKRNETFVPNYSDVDYFSENEPKYTTSNVSNQRVPPNCSVIPFFALPGYP